MENKILIIHVPVIHKGYLDFLNDVKSNVSAVYVMDNELLENLTQFKPDIASINAQTSKDLLEKLGFKNVFVLSTNNLSELKSKDLILIQDEISRNLYDKYFSTNNVEWKSVFLRWDKSKVMAQQNLGDIPVSTEQFDVDMMNLAGEESEKSGDWWRQVGAVAVGSGNVMFSANNKDIPSDHTPYQVGEVRDLFVAGERHDIASTIHAEQSIIAQAAKNGISVEGASIYVTTFPCPVCAKMIACSGIKKVFFREGGSNFDAKKVLESADIKITHVPINLA